RAGIDATRDCKDTPAGAPVPSKPILRLDDLRRLRGGIGPHRLSPVDKAAAQRFLNQGKREEVNIVLPGGRTVSPKDLGKVKAVAPPAMGPSPQAFNDTMIFTPHQGYSFTGARTLP